MTRRVRPSSEIREARAANRVDEGVGQGGGTGEELEQFRQTEKKPEESSQQEASDTEHRSVALTTSWSTAQ